MKVDKVLTEFVPQPVAEVCGVTVTLSREEATAIYAVSGFISGGGTARKLIEDMGYSLAKAVGIDTDSYDSYLDAMRDLSSKCDVAMRIGKED